MSDDNTMMVGRLVLSESCPLDVPYTIPKKWMTSFPRSIRSIEYKTPEEVCTYNMIIDIVYSTYGKRINKMQILEQLLQQYLEKINTPVLFENIKNIWKAQGKWKLVSMLQDIDDFKKLIFSPDYYLTNIDLWLFCLLYTSDAADE